MRYFYFIICLFILTTTQAQTTQDTLYVWKTGQLVIKQSIKPADIDSITFKRPIANMSQVTICSQIWTTKNLDVVTYRDGTTIPQVTSPTQWANLTTGAWCYYNNDPTNNNVYGKLYNWYAVAGIYNAASATNPSLRKILAPIGYHIPTNQEWTTLTTCLGGSSVAGGKMKESGNTHWLSPNNGATNSSGFTGLPGAFCTSTGAFNGIGSNGSFWSFSEYDTTNAWYLVLANTFTSANSFYTFKKNGLSVRCIKD
jgi:uncharacterized protein (TIGR02145 family)